MRAVEINPNFVNGFANLARTFSRLAKLSEAALCFERALLLAPGNEGLSVEYAAILVGSGLFQKAERLLSDTMNSPDAKVLLNYARFKQGKPAVKPVTPPSDPLHTFYAALPG